MLRTPSDKSLGTRVTLLLVRLREAGQERGRPWWSMPPPASHCPGVRRLQWSVSFLVYYKHFPRLLNNFQTLKILMILILLVIWYSVLFSKPFEYALTDTVVSIPQTLAVLARERKCFLCVLYYRHWLPLCHLLLLIPASAKGWTDSCRLELS